jgi:hypothetical protein
LKVAPLQRTAPPPQHDDDDRELEDQQLPGQGAAAGRDRDHKDLNFRW